MQHNNLRTNFIPPSTFALCLCAFVFLILLFNVHPSSALRAATAPAQQTSSVQLAGIPLEILNKVDLHVQWYFADLPLGHASRLIQMFTHGDQLFLINNMGKLYALDAHNGTINWTRSLSTTPLAPPTVSYFDNNLLLLYGNTYYQVRLNNGSIAHQTTFNFDVTTSIARWKNRLFVGANDSRFYSIRLADQVLIWQSLCPAQPLGSVTIDQDRVYFVTRDNTLYVSDAQQRKLLWKAPAVDLLSGVVIDKDQCFLPSYDTALYCLQAQTGKLQWKYLAGGRLTQLPTVTEKFVYQPIEPAALVCLNRLDGSVLWQLKGGKSYLTHNGPTTYVITHDQKLTLMDQRSAKRLASFYLRNFTLYAPSPHNPTIFLATPEGDILALRPNKILKSLPIKKPDLTAPDLIADKGQPPARPPVKTTAPSLIADKGKPLPVSPGSPLRSDDSSPPPPVSSSSAVVWRADLNNVTIPEINVQGLLHGRKFTLDNATLENGMLHLRQGKDFFADFEVVISLNDKAGETLSNKSYNITKDTGLDSPSIDMQWKLPDENLPKIEIFLKDYVMRLEFGDLEDDKIPGKIYLCLSDKEKSVVAGTFLAQVVPDKTTAPPTQPSPASAGSAAVWRENLNNVAFPQANTKGSIHGRNFTLDDASFKNGGLYLRQGKGFFADLEMKIFLFAKKGETPSNKSYNITKGTGPGSPTVYMSWKPPNENLPKSEMFKKNYVMILEFGALKDDKIPGKIYLCLPDKEKSIVAGTFLAKVD